MHGRVGLWHDTWLADIEAKQIPFTKGVDPLMVLATDALIATWKNEGLPADRISIENASVVTACARWPLLIDPQLQGVKWIKQRFGDVLTVVQLTQVGRGVCDVMDKQSNGDACGRTSG